jgi:polygalacturonase
MDDYNDVFTRRSLARHAAAGGLSLAAGGGAAAGAETGQGTWLDARKCGAKGDGKADDTKPLQSALDGAGEKNGGVFLPPGVYLTAELQMRRNTALVGVPAWDYRRGPGGSLIRLLNEKASSLLNITGAPGVTIDGLTLDGGGLGKEVHGVFLNKTDPGKEEDTFRIERSKIMRFSGTGVMLSRVWCFSIRQCMIAYNGGDGVRCLGWDGFILDNWLSGNRGCGWEGTASAAITATGNRIEWNRKAGILVAGGNHYNITGNYIDRSGTSAIAVLPRDGRPSRHLAISGNVINRSGKWAEAETHESSQVRLEGSRGITCVANTLVAGRDDGGRGSWSPSYGFVCKGLENCVVKDNVLDDGALKQLVLDLGGHNDGFILKDNPGRLFQPKA